jgi:hypothetical protein
MLSLLRLTALCLFTSDFGVAAHVWTMEEWLSYRVPPDFRDQLDQQATNGTS